MGTPTPLSIRHYGAGAGSHAHDHFQVIVGLRGVLDLEIEGRGRRIGEGEGLLVAPGERHDFESARGSDCLVLDTATDLWSLCDVTPRRPSQVALLARYLAEALLQHQPLAALQGPGLLLEAWRPRVEPARGAKRPIDWPALSAWVGAHLHESLTVSQLAQRVFLSTSQFALRCHEAHGVGPQEWLRRQRLMLARQLRCSGVAVQEVARRTGYRSPSALTAALRRSGL